MKDAFVDAMRDNNLSFISHMVQMKAIEIQYFKVVFWLYIPHGSDERAISSPLFPRGRGLYIPHGSDERLKDNVQCNWFSRLYIPHGSDESFTSMRYAGEVPHFISHMVQMKDTHIRDVWIGVVFFISHMVQMKGLEKLKSQRPANSLYPTWFRWKR